MWGGAEFTEGKGFEHNEANCAVGYCSLMLAPVVTEPVFWASRCLSVSLCSCLACGLLPQDFFALCCYAYERHPDSGSILAASLT